MCVSLKKVFVHSPGWQCKLEKKEVDWTDHHNNCSQIEPD